MYTFLYRIETKNYGGVAWRLYDKKDKTLYTKEEAQAKVEELRNADENHLYRMAIWKALWTD